MQSSTTLVAASIIAAAVGAGAATLTTQFSAQKPAASDTSKINTRISQLEKQLAAESEARQRLLSQIQNLQADTIGDSDRQILDLLNGDLQTEIEAAELASIEPSEEIELPSQALSAEQYRKQTLLSAGFAEEEANWVLTQEQEVELEQLYAQHKLQREVLAAETPEAKAWLQRNYRNQQLREKLGDDYYERYLKANGWPTQAEIQSVVAGSPGQTAGLQKGDKITAYAGQRVFNMRDLSRLTLEGTEGETVLLEIERDGNPIQITLPRGPIGVSSSNNRFGR